MARMELKEYLRKPKEPQKDTSEGFFMTPDSFDVMYNKTWDFMFQYVSDGSLVHQQLMQVLAQKEAQGNLAYLPPEYKPHDRHGSLQNDLTGADVLFMPYADSVQGSGRLSPREIRKFSGKIQDLAAEVGLQSEAITEPVRLAQGFVAQVIEIQKGVDSTPFPIMMFVPEHGYGALLPYMREVMRNTGNISYCLPRPTISFQLRDGGSGGIVQTQKFGSMDKFLQSMHHMFSTTIMRTDVRGMEIPLSQFVFDPEMVAIYGVDPRTKKQMEELRGPRWQVGVSLKNIYSPTAWDSRDYRWELQQHMHDTSIQIAQGSIPQSIRLGSLYPSDEEKRYREQLCSIGELIMGSNTGKVQSPLLAASEYELAAAIAGMANAWGPILDMAHSEVLYSVLNSTWFTALSYGIAQRSRIHNSLSLPIR